MSTIAETQAAGERPATPQAMPDRAADEWFASLAARFDAGRNGDGSYHFTCPVCGKQATMRRGGRAALFNCPGRCSPNDILAKRGRTFSDTIDPRFRQVGTPAHVQRAIEQEKSEGQKKPGKRKAAGRGICETIARVRCATDVKEEQMDWRWPDRIPIGLTLVVGDADVGKTAAIVDMVARLTANTGWPDGASTGGGGDALYVSSEDSASMTLLPRARAAGADVSRLHFLDGVTEVRADGSRIERGLNLEHDLTTVEESVAALKDCRLFVADPLSALCGRVDTFKGPEVRRILTPLATLAERRRLAVVGVLHLCKNTARSALYRVQLSADFGAVARAIWLVCKDPNDPERRLFLRIKGNLSRPVGGLAFRIRPAASNPAVPIVCWESESVELGADDALAAAPACQETNQRDAAAAWLLDLLADGPVPVARIKAEHKEAGHRWATVRRAKDALGIVAVRNGFGPGGGWSWTLSKGAQSPEHAPKEETVNAYRESEHLYHSLSTDGHNTPSIDAHSTIGAHSPTQGAQAESSDSWGLQ